MGKKIMGGLFELPSTPDNYYTCTTRKNPLKASSSATDMCFRAVNSTTCRNFF